MNNKIAHNYLIISNNYYPFGSVAKGRSFSSQSYRYGFNGKENDSETISTDEGTQDYGLRIYNPALARFFSIDPLTGNYPYYTPYQFAGNKPILATDLDGAEENPTNNGTTQPSTPEQTNQNESSNKTNTNQQVTQNALRNIKINVSGTPAKNTDGTEKFAILYGYPNAPVDSKTNEKKLYKVPLYEVTVSGTLEDGSSVQYKYTAVRFGVEGKKDGSVRVVGKSSEGTFTPTEYIPNYPENVTNEQYKGAIRVDGGFLIHVGQSNPSKNPQGNIGCIAVCQFPSFKQTLLTLSGAKDIKTITDNKLLQVHYEKADYPPLIQYKKNQNPWKIY